MSAKTLKYRYHDAVVERRQVGPRREIILELQLDPVLNPGAPQKVRLRFGGVENFNEVRSFFEKAPGLTNPEAFERVERIAWIEKGKWVIEVDHRGAITIATPKLPQEQ